MISSLYFDWDAVRKFFEDHARCLSMAEQKPSARLGFTPDRYTVVDSGDRRFVVVTDEVFEWILTNDLPEATRKHPDSFGTGEPEDVLKALWDVRSGYGNFSYEEYKEAIFTEKFCWMVEIDIQSKLPVGPLLRVDLSRGVAANKNATGEGNSFRFEEGVFHAFRHFALDGIPLSYNKDRNDISSPLVVIDLIILGFFLSERRPDRNDVGSYIEYDSKNVLHFIFRHKEACDVYFIKNIIKKRKSKVKLR